MSRRGAEIELLLISEAVARFEVGMYGNVRRPEAVTEAKKAYPGFSIGFGPQKEHAATLIADAVMNGELSVFVVPDSTESHAHRTPLQVPLDVLRKMVRTRGGLPDHVVQPLRIFAKRLIAPELFKALSKSALYLRRKEFEVWYKKAKKKRNSPCYSYYLRHKPTNKPPKPRMGRPSRQNDLRNSIIAMKGRWQKIADLVRLLQSEGKTATRDTTRRVVDQLFRETGKKCYQRRVRKRSTLKR